MHRSGSDTAISSASDSAVASFDPELAAAAKLAAQQAYAPFSQFYVGCAIRSQRGAVYRGCNVENSAYPLGGCAERHAIAAGVQAEGPDFRIADLVVLAFDREQQAQQAAPCGGCRQQIFELGPDARVNFIANDAPRCLHIGELLPFGFRL
ncbi:cytidine deaminase [Aquimonas sp.]|jgi:cytidine deaminase|uniref:cytidine deaminase n=1 Tax=Aquimonas sp. TaxID=1872588 RepID=UPI0037BF8401